MKLDYSALALAVAASLAVFGFSAAEPAPHHDQPAAEHGQRSPNSLGEGWSLQQDEVRQGVRQHRLMPLGRVIERLRQTAPGHQLDAGLEYEGSRPVYRVRWMTKDGRRVDYLIDAATGTILGEE
jgi:uncharacterized membrane protein YkoI